MSHGQDSIRLLVRLSIFCQALRKPGFRYALDTETFTKKVVDHIHSSVPHHRCNIKHIKMSRASFFFGYVSDRARDTLIRVAGKGTLMTSGSFWVAVSESGACQYEMYDSGQTKSGISPQKRKIQLKNSCVVFFFFIIIITNQMASKFLACKKKSVISVPFFTTRLISIDFFYQTLKKIDIGESRFHFDFW